MFKHDKQLLREVRVDAPNPNYAAMIQEQLGGPQGELKAALQYLSQSFRIKDPAIQCSGKPSIRFRIQVR